MKTKLLFPLFISIFALSACTFKINTSDFPHSENIVAEISLNESSINLEINETKTLVATVRSEEKNLPPLSWVSSDNKIASVNSSGVVTGIGPGKTVVTVSLKDTDIKASCQVEVSNEIQGSVLEVSDTDVNYYSLDSTSNVNSKGDQKVLVIPLYFTDDTAKATEENRLFIEKSFFGSNEECGWRSFKGYYEEASFNQLHYSGFVADTWYAAPFTKQEAKDDSNVTQSLVHSSFEWFIENYPEVDLSEYDTNEDGIIDSYYLIYASDFEYNTNLWGYRWSYFGGEKFTNYKISAFSWFSIQFLQNTGDYGGVPSDGSNTRIIIHEHGHMLGLPDYYDTSYQGNGVDYTGSFDMQAFNAFDWNSVSKYLVGWNKPYYVNEDKLAVKKEETITLRPSTTTGDCLIIPTGNWNGTPFDEYLMVELINPELGNNNYDYHYSTYQGIQDCGYGVKIFHVNSSYLASRLSDTFFNKYEFYEVDDFSSLGDDDSIFQATDNAFVDSDNHNYNLKYYRDYYSSYFTNINQMIEKYQNTHFLHLLQKGNVNTFSDPEIEDIYHCWNEDDLWRSGDTFSIGNHEGYTNYGPNFFDGNTFTDGTSLNYGLRFDEVTPEKAVITLTYFD